jgi:hypothetical protein
MTVGDICIFRSNAESYSGEFVWETRRLIIKEGTVGIFICSGFTRDRVLTVDGVVWIWKWHIQDNT